MTPDIHFMIILTKQKAHSQKRKEFICVTSHNWELHKSNDDELNKVDSSARTIGGECWWV